MNRLLILLTFTFFGSALNAQKAKEYFHPKQPFEQRIDTTISATDISWVFRTISDEHITQEYQDGNKLFKYYYRDTELNIRTANFEQTFTKMNFQDSIGFEPGVFTMNFLGFEGFNERTSELHFFLTVNKPDTDWTYPIYLFVNLNGSSRFELPTFEDDY